MSRDETLQHSEARVLAFCGQEGLFRPGQRVAAAVSGGADSMALVRILLALAAPLGITLSVCHVNHGLRGAAAARDEAFVRDACAALGLPLRVFRAGEEGLPLAAPGEDGARALRYQCFARLHAEGIERIATAHTVSDQAETLLFRLARGTGLHGAAGIRPARGFYVRPLLCLTRAETEACCEAFGQPWVTDETNLSDDYARNRLRHHALPALRQANAGAERNMARFCEKAARADAYFSRMADAALDEAAAQARLCCPPALRPLLDAGAPFYALGPLRAADELVLEQAARRLVAAQRDPEEKYIRLLCTMVREGRGALQLGPGARLRAGQGLLWQEDAKRRDAANAAGFCTPFCPEKQAEYPLAGGKCLVARLISATFQEKTQGVHKKDLKNVADYARITMSHPALTLRSRLPGDSYRPAGRGVTKPLRKWMNEQAIPPEERDRLPLLADGSEVIWVCGAGFAEGLAPDGTAGPVLCMDVTEQQG